MTRSPVSLALKIATLIEDHTDRELQSAVKLLERYGSGQLLIDYLSTTNAKAKTVSATRKIAPYEEGVSRAVLNLEERDPEKFHALSEFESAARQGKILGSNDALRSFGKTISKTFEAKKSRKENLNAVLNVLSTLSLNEIKRFIEISQTLNPSKDSDNYQKLARFIIKGRSD